MQRGFQEIVARFCSARHLVALDQVRLLTRMPSYRTARRQWIDDASDRVVEMLLERALREMPGARAES